MGKKENIHNQRRKWCKEKNERKLKNKIIISKKIKDCKNGKKEIKVNLERRWKMKYEERGVTENRIKRRICKK